MDRRTGRGINARADDPASALATIVPYVAFMPGLGLPMENNVGLTANYG